MKQITLEHNPSPAKLEVMGVFQWPVWRKEVSKFAWTYNSDETCYLLEGEAVVTPEDGNAVTIKRGDLVSFPAGMNCTWDILNDVEKHYKLG